MKKIKILIASMLSAIVLVFAAVFGGSVDAATSHTATYEWRAGDGKGVSGDMFYFNNGSMSTTDENFSQTIDGITFTKYDTPTSSSRTLIINLDENEWSNNTVTAYVYLYTTTKTRTITIGGIDKGKTTMNGIQYFTDILTSSANRIVLGGDGVAWCGVDLVLTATASAASLTSISATDGSKFAVGDKYSSTNLVVTGNFDDSTSSTLSSSKYTYTITDPNGDEFDKGTAFTVTGTYTINIEATEGSFNTTTTFTVVDSIKYNVTYHYNNGDANTSVEVAKGAKLITPVPSYDGYAFAGWYSNESMTTAFVTNSTAVNSDLNLYAKYVDYVTLPQAATGDNVVNVSNLTNQTKLTTVTAGIFTFNSASEKMTIENNNKSASGVDFTKRLKMGATGSTSTVNVSMTLPKGKLYVVCQTGNTATDGTLKLYNGTSDIQTVNVHGQYALAYEFDINASGNYKLYGSTSINYYYLEFVPTTEIADSATITVDAEKNSDGTQLRFITTLEGVEVSKVASIELVIYKDSVADANRNKGHLYMTSVYTSISNAGSTYATKTNTYYGIVKLTNAQSLKSAATTLYFNTIVTYTDGSQASMATAKTYDLSTL